MTAHPLPGAALVLVTLLACAAPRTGAVPPPASALDTPTASPDAGPAAALNIAHRGGRRLAPESTLVAFRRALEVGADALELDVHGTRDGVVVVAHDRTVDRTTNGTGRISAMSFAELRALDAGHRFRPDRAAASYPWRGRALTIPTLREVLAAFPDVPVMVEIKQSRPSIVTAVLADIDACGAAHRVVLASTDDRTLAEIRAARPEIRTSFSASEVLGFLALSPRTEAGYRPPTGLLQVPARLIDARFVARARRHGLEVHAWTVNDADEMRRLIRLGVDGVMTDRPDRLTAVLRGEQRLAKQSSCGAAVDVPDARGRGSPRAGRRVPRAVA